MKVMILITIINLLAGCSGKHAVRVDCERNLVPINVPAPAASEAPSHGEDEGSPR